MPAKEKAPASSPASHLAGWARQGVESFVAAQKILLDLAAQENALVFGMVRERLSKPAFRPDNTIAKMVDKGVETSLPPVKSCWTWQPERPRWWWTV